MFIKLNVNKSAGVDTLGPRILKIAAGIITKPITSMINMSIFTGVFPEKLKTAKVTPIYKKGDKSDPGNYRPISILPTISKLFERHITTQMYDYLKENDLLMKEQSGFRKSHSCQTALTKLTEKWITDIDNGNMTGVSLLDFRKAFDLVNHKILIDKMKYYNFTNETLNWLESYLSNRTQTVHIGNVSSNLSAITCGVPQGSVLGPVLFLLYINDLPLHVKNSILDLFADDATLHKANNNLLEIERDMNEDMDHISAWCKENRMVINESKTKCILVGARQKISRLPTTTLSLKVNDKLIDNLTSDKLLGVYIDNYLQFDKHIDEVCKAITQKIALLRRIKKYLGLQHRVLYYNAYILPSIDYCLTIYGNASKSHLDRILKLQKSAARVIMDAPPDTPSQPLFDELDWLNIYDRCIFNKRVLLFKIFNNQAPSYLLDLFSETSNSNYQLRSITDRDLSIPRHKTEFYKRSLQYSGVILWNELPTHIRLSNSLPTFKNSLKPKTQKGKRFLEHREPKIFENVKKTLFLKGGNTHVTVSQALKELYLLKKQDAVMYKRKNILRPFEDETPLEFFAKKSDASLFLFGSHSKKRPNNLVLGRMFDFHVLDMIELGIDKFTSMSEIEGNKCPVGTKPCLMFAGEAFDTDIEYQRLKNLLIDFFRGPVVEQVRLSGLEHTVMITAADGKIFIRNYKILMKKSGCKTPRIELENMGPSLDLVMRRTKLASDDFYKRALKQPITAKPRKKKNISQDAFGSKLGRIHMQKQDLGKLQTRKMKGLKRQKGDNEKTDSEEPTQKRKKSNKEAD
ncbi:hypothetical protein FSP39_003001 [Pinctada imbricata]|uniref:Ribosome production factor 2 homolog n=1 Tax=Pinctada imbricata TaxID=66713 RepID=A0AA88Y7A1_PINIB|nr:hypothetical protein FSP39_003001 [Pinctada imbricata]